MTPVAKPIETILRVGAEGGSITLQGRMVDADWQFRLAREERLLDEDAHGQSNWIDTWPDALMALDRYPWARLYPLDVHPLFADRVRAGVAAARTAMATGEMRLTAEEFGLEPDADLSYSRKAEPPLESPPRQCEVRYAASWRARCSNKARWTG